MLYMLVRHRLRCESGGNLSLHAGRVRVPSSTGFYLRTCFKMRSSGQNLTNIVRELTIYFIV